MNRNSPLEQNIIKSPPGQSLHLPGQTGMRVSKMKEEFEMNEGTTCLHCQKRTGMDRCWWYGKMTLGDQIRKIVYGCEKFRKE